MQVVIEFNDIEFLGHEPLLIKLITEVNLRKLTEKNNKQYGLEKRKGKSTDFPLKYGAPGRIRTRDPLVRSQVLYPTELPARGVELCTFLLEDAIGFKKYF